MPKNFKSPPLTPFAATVEQLLHQELAAELSARPNISIQIVDHPSRRYVLLVGEGVKASKIDAALDRLGYDRFPAGYGGRGMSSVVCYPGYVHAVVDEDRFELHALVSYEGRESAKKAGFNWKPGIGKCVKEVDVKEFHALEETAMFKFEVARRFFVKIHAAVPEGEDLEPRTMKPKISAGAELAGLRRTFGGPAKVMNPCRWCGESFAARELRKHQGPCGRSKRA